MHPPTKVRYEYTVRDAGFRMRVIVEDVPTRNALNQALASAMGRARVTWRDEVNGEPEPDNIGYRFRIYPADEEALQAVIKLLTTRFAARSF